MTFSPERRTPALQGLIRARRSIRRYRPEPVAPEVVERLLAAATWAPSAHNRQPWRFVVLAERETRKLLALAMGDQLQRDRAADGDDPAAIAADLDRSRARIVEAPVVVLACLTMAEMDNYPDRRRRKAEYTMAVQSVAMAMQNLLLAAEAEGLGACWMCAPLFCPEVVCEALGLPEAWEAQALVTLGYPAEPGRVRPRKDVRNVAVWK